MGGGGGREGRSQRPRNVTDLHEVLHPGLHPSPIRIDDIPPSLVRKPNFIILASSLFDVAGLRAGLELALLVSALHQTVAVVALKEADQARIATGLLGRPLLPLQLLGQLKSSLLIIELEEKIHVLARLLALGLKLRSSERLGNLTAHPELLRDLFRAHERDHLERLGCLTGGSTRRHR